MSYEPDGWLGTQFGNQLYMDCFGEAQVSKIGKSLLREIQRFVHKSPTPPKGQRSPNGDFQSQSI